MSQLAHPITTFRAHWIVAVAGLLALAATAAVVLVLAIDGSSSSSSSTPAVAAAVTPSTQSGPRYDGGPNEGSSLAQSNSDNSSVETYGPH